MKHERLATEESNHPLTSHRTNTAGNTEIQRHLAEQQMAEARLSEKITPAKAVMFICYYICLIQSVLLMVNVSETYYNNLSLYTTLTNSLNTDTGYEAIDRDKIAFHEIDTFADISKWFVNGLLYTLYSSEVGFQSFDFVPDNKTFLYYQTISPLRFTQVRNRKTNLVGIDPVYPRMWTKDAPDETESYGKNGWKFNYSEVEGGFVYKIPIAYQSQASTVALCNQLVTKSGFFEDYMKHLKIDVVVFNKVNYYFSFIQASFKFSPAGLVRKKDIKIFSYPAEPYKKPGDPALLGFQIIYAMIFLFYFSQEFVKVYVQIKNAFLNNQMKGSGNLVANATNALRQKILNVLKGLLNHIKDPLTFVNLVTIIFSFYTLFKWLDYRYSTDVTDDISALQMSEGVINNITEAKKNIFLGLNYKVEQQKSLIESIYLVSSLNMIVLTIKCINYVAFLYEPMKNFQSNFSSLITKNIPLIIYTVCLMISFCVFIYFYFGRHISEFQDGYFSILVYFFINLNSQMDYVDDMFRINPGVTIMFLTTFGIFGNFIMIAMFQIFSVHAYDETQQKLSKKKPKHHVDEGAHWTYKLKMMVIRDFRIWVYEWFNKHKAAKLKDKFSHEARQMQLEMNAFHAFNYDLKLENEHPEAKKSAFFRNEITNFKLIRNKKIEYIKYFWATIGTVSMILIFMTISLEHHKITEGRRMVSSADSILKSKSVITINDAGKKVVTVSKRTMKQFQRYYDVLDWFRLFQALGDRQTFKLSSGEQLDGFFFGGVNYLLTEQYRITIRRAYVVKAPESIYNDLSSITISGTFPPLVDSTPYEYTGPFVGVTTGIIYNYTKEGSFYNKGGYVQFAKVNEIYKVINRSISDMLIDNVMMSITIDWPIYQPTSKNMLYGIVQMELDDSYNFKMDAVIDLLPLNFYESSQQKFIAFLEVGIFFSFFLTFFWLWTTTKAKYIQYNHWFSLHISYFPEIMRFQRKRKQPEFFRRWNHCVKFGTFTDIWFLVNLMISIILWFYYLFLRSHINDEIDLYIHKSPAADFNRFVEKVQDGLDVINTAKVNEALLLLVICLKLVHDLAYFKSFRFLVETMEKSIMDLITLLVVLIFYLLAFALFLNVTLGQKFIDYENIGTALCIVQQLISGMNPRMKNQLFIYNDYYMISTIFFYIPFLFAIIFIIKYTFLAVLTHYYRVAKAERELENEIHFSISFMDFVKLTYEILFKKKKKTKIGFHISDQIIYDIRLNKVFDEFNETVELKYNLKDMDMWATQCAKDIMSEYDNRKKIKKFAKEMTQTRLTNELTEGADNTKMDIDSKVLEGKMRLKYWDYFRNGNLRLLEFMLRFKEYNAGMEIKTSNPQFIRDSKKADEKIKKYIIFLERNNEIALTEVTRIRSVIDKMSKVSTFKGSTLNLPTF